MCGMYMCAEVQGRSQGLFFRRHPSWFFETGTLIGLELSKQGYPGWPANPRDALVFASLVLGLQVYITRPGFLKCTFWGLNSGP